LGREEFNYVISHGYKITLIEKKQQTVQVIRNCTQKFLMKKEEIFPFF